jgi:hypothetical protein
MLKRTFNSTFLEWFCRFFFLRSKLQPFANAYVNSIEWAIGCSYGFSTWRGAGTICLK